MDWFRTYHGLCTDPKLHRVKIAARVHRSVAIAAWMAVLETASKATARGSAAECDADVLAFMIDESVSVADRLLTQFRAFGMIDPDGKVAAWDRRQRPSDDEAKKKARQREAKALQTNNSDGECPGTVPSRTEQNREEKKEAPPVGGAKKEPDAPPVATEPAAPAASPPSPPHPPAKVKPVKTSRGTRLPDGWEPGPDGIAYAVAVGLTVAQAEDQAERMRLWARNAQGSKGVKLDWVAAWHGWCRRAADDIAQRPLPRGQPNGFHERGSIHVSHVNTSAPGRPKHFMFGDDDDDEIERPTLPSLPLDS